MVPRAVQNKEEKKVKGYIKESDVKMNLKSSAAGLVTGVKPLSASAKTGDERGLL